MCFLSPVGLKRTPSQHSPLMGFVFFSCLLRSRNWYADDDNGMESFNLLFWNGCRTITARLMLPQFGTFKQTQKVQLKVAEQRESGFGYAPASYASIHNVLADIGLHVLIIKKCPETIITSQGTLANLYEPGIDLPLPHSSCAVHQEEQPLMPWLQRPASAGVGHRRLRLVDQTFASYGM